MSLPWTLMALLAATGPPNVRQAPFAAVATAATNVRAGPELRFPVVGLLHRGARVEVTSCVPDCNSEGAWGWLGTDGAVRLALLLPSDEGGSEIPPEPTHLIHGKVLGTAAAIYALPDVHARVLRREPGGRVLAFAERLDLLGSGWLDWMHGGFVAVSAVRLATGSTLEGEKNPHVPLAFLRQRMEIKDASRATWVERYSRYPVLALDLKRVELSVGAVPKTRVRIAYARPRPDGVPAGARWVHVDLNEEILTAYEGDSLVFATLVSTGTRLHPTRTGLFRVWYKGLHDLMHGEGYFVDEVPDVLYFHGGEALHAAFWHEHFGSPVTHGCVNLSPADAAWLFDWAPPVMPAGWHSRMPGAGDEALFVRVERAPPGPPPFNDTTLR